MANRPVRSLLPALAALALGGMATGPLPDVTTPPRDPDDREPGGPMGPNLTFTGGGAPIRMLSPQDMANLERARLKRERKGQARLEAQKREQSR